MEQAAGQKEFIETLKFIIQIPGGATVLFFLVKWTINNWFKKNTEIEKLKADLSNKELESMKEKTESLNKLIQFNITRTDQYINKTEILTRAQQQTANQIGLTANQLNKVATQVSEYAEKDIDSMELFAEQTTKRIEQLEQFNNDLSGKIKASSANYKSEQIKVGADSVLIKSKKD